MNDQIAYMVFMPQQRNYEKELYAVSWQIWLLAVWRTRVTLNLELKNILPERGHPIGATVKWCLG